MKTAMSCVQPGCCVHGDAGDCIKDLQGLGDQSIKCRCELPCMYSEAGSTCWQRLRCHITAQELANTENQHPWLVRPAVLQQLICLVSACRCIKVTTTSMERDSHAVLNTR